MRVKCRNIYNENIKQYEDINPWITIGKEYVVLEVEIYPGKDILYRLISDQSDESPALFNAKQFDIVSGQLCSSWRMSLLSGGILNLGPASWESIGFWEKCYDGDVAALEVYKHEVELMIKEDGTFNF